MNNSPPKKIIRSEGENDTEIILSKICDNTFLKLWVYPNPYMKQADELLDVLSDLFLQHGMPVIGHLVGHKNSVTTKKYAHHRPDGLRKTTERLGQVIEMKSTKKN